ncbi:UDP-N-acetylmuramoyl-L-alanyl-D-glutamate--2,6-diaminopimelate ligase [Magnetospira sp. QH-2]|uniref:UDP-N-acetylmuramoyl-L-alanyl-D-glutamate--2, 6-diaminopimelate ligase n=1 Tax=Magnetospira sp. (strain QH-2) TaxID=1288970 RepID=UPI0003E819F8|nr:UDP-N-acetylmuramoyl-L-alanyl-D-glutamate--2,6-diaminopimelate ligase [Magnetospira sp. QH-2]CCQ72809.1 UDP-N-acetylmuramoylalanyl-D-glutamate 2, 6-diaminopimelate ligase (UDP-N-acetylmuramyl-tripeptide synthetase) [Magnetospira sp. QH-2]
MRLSDLIEGNRTEVNATAAEYGMEITGLTCDSRKVAPGYLFAALPGTHNDGRAYISEALRRGASAVLAPPGTQIDDANPDIALLTDDNPRRRYALLAARLHPGQPDRIAAVTGTNGKTSVAHFVRQIWTRLGHRAGSLGTTGVDAPGLHGEGGLTTPDPADLHEMLDKMAENRVDRLAMEASSHGLDQYRLDGVRVTAAGFTNLSRDHMDYHGDEQSYLAAKMRLFGEVMAPGGWAVLNTDIPQFEALQALCAERRHRLLTYGRCAVDLRLVKAKPVSGGQSLTLNILGTRFEILLPLAGDFQVANALCALGLCIADGAHPRLATEALEHLVGVPGRLQKVATTATEADVYVDYAHTPDALETVLAALRPHTQGRLSLVFGCGGDRDQGKRPLMGELANRLADTVIVTDDNPRSEDPGAIRQQILKACPGATEIGDRAEAITQALEDLGPQDVLLVAGKGHERGQIVGDKVLPFDDTECVRQWIGEAFS